MQITKGLSSAQDRTGAEVQMAMQFCNLSIEFRAPCCISYLRHGNRGDPQLALEPRDMLGLVLCELRSDRLHQRPSDQSKAVPGLHIGLGSYSRSQSACN